MEITDRGNDHETLAFDKAEVKDLTTVLGSYYTHFRDGPELSFAESRFLRKLWLDLCDLDMFRHFQEGSHLDVSFETYRRERARITGRQVTVSEVTDRFRVRNQYNWVGKAFDWAALNLVAGSVVMQNRVGSVLNTELFGVISNDALAERMSRSYLQAGRSATRWATQLLEQ